MEQYKGLIRELINKYDEQRQISGDRTGVGTVKVVGRHLRFDLAKGFPLLTLKKTVWKPMVAELLWFLKGSTDNNELVAMGANFWTPWAVHEKDIIEYILRNTTLPHLKETILSLMMLEEYYAQFDITFEEADLANELSTTGRHGWILIRTDIDEVPCWAARHPNYDALLLDKLIEAGIATPNSREMLGKLGPIYGASWTGLSDVRIVDEAMLSFAYAEGFEDLNFTDEGKQNARIVGRSINQIQNAMDLLINSPNSRRIKVSAWEPRHLPIESMSPQQNVLEGRACLAYCHDNFQFVTEELSFEERFVLLEEYILAGKAVRAGDSDTVSSHLNEQGIPKYRLHCLESVRKYNCGLAA